MMQFKPSDIMFSQDSISNYFAKRSRHNGVLIGKTLDDLCEGRCRVAYIPTIKVLKKDGKWVTADNRRLWVFRECERLGKCDKIPVRQTLNIPQSKMNSPNGGVSVKVRGNPGGLWHNRPTVRRQESQGTSVGDPKPNVYVSPSPFSNVLALSVVTQTTSTPDTLTSSSSTYSRPICCDQEPENRMHSSVQFVTETTNLAVAESTPATVLSNLPSEVSKTSSII